MPQPSSSSPSSNQRPAGEPAVLSADTNQPSPPQPAPAVLERGSPRRCSVRHLSRTNSVFSDLSDLEDIEQLLAAAADLVDSAAFSESSGRPLPPRRNSSGSLLGELVGESLPDSPAESVGSIDTSPRRHRILSQPLFPPLLEADEAGRDSPSAADAFGGSSDADQQAAYGASAAPIQPEATSSVVGGVSQALHVSLKRRLSRSSMGSADTAATSPDKEPAGPQHTRPASGPLTIKETMVMALGSRHTSQEPSPRPYVIQVEDSVLGPDTRAGPGASGSSDSRRSFAAMCRELAPGERHEAMEQFALRLEQALSEARNSLFAPESSASSPAPRKASLDLPSSGATSPHGLASSRRGSTLSLKERVEARKAAAKERRLLEQAEVERRRNFLAAV